MKLSVIILNYNVQHFLEQTLLAAQKAVAFASFPCELIVVDNNSSDGSVEMVRRRFPEITLMARTDNPGFAAGNNYGIEISTGEYCLLLNPDTVVAEDTFEKIIVFVDAHPDCGGLGIKMVDGQGVFLPESKRGLPTPKVSLFKMLGLSRLFPKSKTFNHYHLGYLSKNETHEVEILSGAFMLLRKSVLDEIGLLDETFFMYGEDVDLSYRIIKAGYKNYYFADTTIIHYKGESTKKGSLNYVRIFYNAMIIFAQKHFAGGQSGLYTSFIQVGIYLRAALALLTRWVSRLLPVVFDIGILFVGLLFLKDFYAKNIIGVENYYSDAFLYVNVPLYISIWLVSIYFSGGFDRPFRLWKLIRGILFGTLIISAVYGFLDEQFRFSRALILLGSVWGILTLPISHWFFFSKLGKNAGVNNEASNKMTIVGSLSESQRVQQLLNDAGLNFDLIGLVDPSNQIPIDHKNRLGELSKLGELNQLYPFKEIIFCSKDLDYQTIIETIEQHKSEANYKIINPESDTFIGSNSKNTAGDLYTLEGSYNILQTAQKRNKRLLDIGLSAMILLTAPLHFLWNKKPMQLLQNALTILGGKKSWVGYPKNLNKQDLKKLPPIKEGVLDPSHRFPKINMEKIEINNATQFRLSTMYAKEYSVYKDLEIFWKGVTLRN